MVLEQVQILLMNMWVAIIGAMALMYLPIIEPFLITRHLTIIVLLSIIILIPGKQGQLCLKPSHREGFVLIFDEIVPMSLPQKKRGFRKIVIDGKEFSWRFNSQIEVCPASSKANKLLVDFGWFDSLLYTNDKLASPPDYDPQIVTPSFVRKVIEFALSHNWDIAANTGITKVEYRDNQFNVVLQS